MGVKSLIKNLLTSVFSEKVILFKRREKNQVFLTFDDGPNPDFTEKILDILKAYDVKAQFYLIGTNAQKHPEIVKRMVREGHVIASHSFSHKGFGKLPWSEQKQEIIRGLEVVQQFAPEQELLFRPPQGRFNFQQILFCKKQKITLVMWTVDSMDYSRTMTRDAITERLKNFSWDGGEIVLFHDDNQTTVDMLGEFIRWIKLKKMECAV